jgi:redox-sensitive bicupin YhaK (pirin superfamily)
MITIRPRHERGTANFGWLDSRHTFSFGNYYDPQHMGFASLRVINEDKVTPAKGFGTHGHRDMEIISYVLSGALEHRDSMGNGSVIHPGDVQRMSAGTGITHSEFNASATEPVHLLQIWLLPNERGLQPSYEEKHFSPQEKPGQLILVGSSDGRDNSVTIHQDVNLYVASLKNSDTINYQIDKNRAVWIQVAKGSISLNGKLLEAGDGAAIVDETQITLTANNDTGEILLFDMAQ